MIVTIVGRGHSGTRAIAETLYKSGVYMGHPLNSSYDLIPAEPMYEASHIVNSQVKYIGHNRWDFEAVLESLPSKKFMDLIHIYLSSMLAITDHRGWKLPETTFTFPWLVQMYPDIKYIHWVRDPRDNILDIHITDDLDRFGISHSGCIDNMFHARAISWKYQDDIIRVTPQPKNFMVVRFEDFILDQDTTLQKLEDFLDMPLVKIAVRKESVGRHKKHPLHYTFLDEPLYYYGYIQ